MVNKMEMEMTMVIDYRKLNLVTIPTKYATLEIYEVSTLQISEIINYLLLLIYRVAFTRYHFVN